jgi:hypothetical protein
MERTDLGIESRYPAPDRSDIAPAPNEGSATGFIAGNRPYRIESWSQDDNDLLTIFFSDLGIEDASADVLLRLVEPVITGPDMLVSPKWRRLSQGDVHRIKDARGNTMYSLTFIVISAGEK